MFLTGQLLTAIHQVEEWALSWHLISSQGPRTMSAGSGVTVRHSAGGGPVLLNAVEEQLRVVLPPLPPVSLLVPRSRSRVSSSRMPPGLRNRRRGSWEVSCCSRGAGGGRGLGSTVVREGEKLKAVAELGRDDT